MPETNDIRPRIEIEREGSSLFLKWTIYGTSAETGERPTFTQTLQIELDDLPVRFEMDVYGFPIKP